MEPSETTIVNRSRFRKYSALVRQDLATTYSRDLHEWLLIAPILGVVTGLVITFVAVVILRWMWPPVLAFYLAHRFAMVPGIAAGFVVAGLIMQYLTPDPNEHSTEEIIKSYHEHQGKIAMRPFLPKMLAAAATVGFGGSSALEGPSIYGGGALGSWLWTKFRFFRRDPRNRRIMLISGAAAGMAAVFRAPLTGIIFALEMPYKDDLAHEALLPSLIASVVSYSTLAAFLGAGPVFDFDSSGTFAGKDLLWSALLGAAIGLVAMTFDITFRRARTFVVGLSMPHWVKMGIGGALTGLCGLVFISIFHGSLVPIGANYEAVPEILLHPHRSLELVSFGAFKLLATLFSISVGGVSAMFVPLFLTGGTFGVAFAQSIVHTPAIDLYAAVGMSAFIAGAYKTPLTAVIFVAEATGGHSYIIPALIGAAVAYAVSGEASVSGDQRLHEALQVADLWNIPVREVMQTQVISAKSSASLREFAETVRAQHLHAAYPVSGEDGHFLGVIAMRSLSKVPAAEWDRVTVGELADREVGRVPPDSGVTEALRMLTAKKGQDMLLVTSPASADGELQGILTRADILGALKDQDGSARAAQRH